MRFRRSDWHIPMPEPLIAYWTAWNSQDFDQLPRLLSSAVNDDVVWHDPRDSFTGILGQVQSPATVFLENNNIAYTSLPYEHNPAADSYGLEAAAKLGLDPGTVFKTLMARLDDDRGELVVAIVPVTGKLDLKALARAADAKRAKMAAVPDAERSSGFVAGGISPFGQKRQLRTFVDETAEICDTIYVSGGQRGLDIGLSPRALVRSLDAIVAPLAT